MSCFTVAARKKKREGSNLGAFLAAPCAPPRFIPKDRIQAVGLHHTSALPSLLLRCPVFSSPHVNPGTPCKCHMEPAGRRLSQHRALFGNPSLAYYGAIGRVPCSFFWHAGRVAASGVVQTTLTCISMWGPLSVLWGVAEW